MAGNPEKLIIFDIDGTLMLSGPVIRQIFGAAFGKACGKPAVLDGIPFAGKTDRGIFRMVLSISGVEGDFEAMFSSFVKEFLRELRQVYPRARGPHLMPGIRDLLDSLEERDGVALALGTGNIQESASIKIGRFDLMKYFPVGGFGDRCETRAEVFREAIRKAGEQYHWDESPGKTWVVGDTPADIQAARECGIRVLAVATGPHSVEELERLSPDAVLPDLRNTAEVVSILNS